MFRGRPSPRRAGAAFLVAAGALALGAVLFSIRASAKDPPGGPAGTPPVPIAIAPLPGDTGFVVPGVLRVTHVDATHEGWTIVEGPSGPAVWIDPSGRAGPPLGRPGQGPGELDAARFASRLGDRVAVLDLSGRQLDELAPGMPPVRRRIEAPGCAASMAEDLTADAEGWLVLRRCLAPGRADAQLIRVGLDGRTRVLAGVPLVRDGVTDPFLRSFVVADGSVRLGRTRSDCLSHLSGPGSGEVCMASVAPIPVPSDLRRAFETGLARRARAAGVRYFLPEELPAFMDVRPAPVGWAVQRLRADGGEFWTIEVPGLGAVEPRPPPGVRLEPGPSGLLLLAQEAEALRGWIVPAPRVPPDGSAS